MKKTYDCEATSSIYRWNEEYQVLEYKALDDDSNSDEWDLVDEEFVGEERVEISLSELYRLVECKLNIKERQ